MNAPAPQRPAWPVRVLRSAATIGLTLGVMLLLTIAALGWLPHADNLFSVLATSHGNKLPPGTAIAVAIGILVLPPLGVYWARRKAWLSDPVLLVSWALLLAVGVWLSWDDAAIRRPLTMDEFSPAFPGATESYRVLMRYGSQSDDPAAKAFAVRQLAVQFAGATPANTEAWRKFITANRAALEADWDALAPERRWLDELAAFDRIGDLTPANLAAAIPRFQVWRTLSQRTAAHASLLALDGRGDEAIASLLPLIEVSRKLEVYSRTLVRTMIMRVVQRQTIDAAGFILDATSVSPAQKTRLAAALGTANPAAGARRLVLIEYAAFVPVFGRMKLGDIRSENPLPFVVRCPLNALSALLFNPNATANRYGEAAFELAGLAERRELDSFAARQQTLFEGAIAHGGMKNAGGRLLLITSCPAYDKVVKSYWDTEDRRAALLARLRS